VDSWLQSLKSGIGGPAAAEVGAEDAPDREGHDRRASLDGAHGAHRHYVHGSVTASDASIVPLIDKYALAAQIQAKNLLEKSRKFYPGHIVRHKGGSVLDSIGLDGDCPESIRQLITDEHLIQLGDMIGDASCTKLQGELSIEGACSSPLSLFGTPDATVDWEPSTSGETDGMTIFAERKLLRDNYYLYRTVVEIQGILPTDVRPFHLDDQARSLWDDSCIMCERDIPPGESRISKHAESCMHRYVSRFPRPLSGRTYEYARRVWTRPSDGGCYAICKSCDLPSGDQPALKKYVKVIEYISACCIEAIDGGTRITTVYFENNQARPGLNKIAVPKGMLPFWSKYESSLRVFAQAKRVNTSAPHRRKSLDELHDAAEVGSGSDYASDDEVYDTLAKIKHESKVQKRRSAERAGSEKISKWVKRIVVAGAVKAFVENAS